jgi:hypothetical protein
LRLPGAARIFTGTTADTFASRLVMAGVDLRVTGMDALQDVERAAEKRAGDRGRTGDVQLGKLAFYH